MDALLSTATTEPVATYDNAHLPDALCDRDTVQFAGEALHDVIISVVDSRKCWLNNRCDGNDRLFNNRGLSITGLAKAFGLRAACGWPEGPLEQQTRLVRHLLLMENPRHAERWRELVRKHKQHARSVQKHQNDTSIILW